MSSEQTPLLRAASFASPSVLWKSGAAFVAVGIITGAFGTHALRNHQGMTSERVHGWETAAHYSIYNGLALMLVSMHPRFSIHRFAGPAIAAGSLIFSSTIMVVALSQGRLGFLGPLTPLGGTIMTAGYLSLLL